MPKRSVAAALYRYVSRRCTIHFMTSTTFDYCAFEDYQRAVHKARWRDWFSWLTRKCNDLLAFEQIRPSLAHQGNHLLGLQVVPLDKIAGSEGRVHDFDRAFFPRQIHTKERWLSIARAFYAQVPLPPVDLIKVGEMYFVIDGHHRISVARVYGQEFIDAYVTEIALPNGASVRAEGDL